MMIVIMLNWAQLSGSYHYMRIGNLAGRLSLIVVRDPAAAALRAE